jgi:hypothetical protein
MHVEAIIVLILDTPPFLRDIRFVTGMTKTANATYARTLRSANSPVMAKNYEKLLNYAIIIRKGGKNDSSKILLARG